jgi:sugar transferase (PEP-CTERM/EpsH1 system associated)
MKPALLFLAHRIPYPPNKGDKIRSFNLLKHLSRTHRVFLGTFVDDAADRTYVEDLSAYCTEIYAGSLYPAICRPKSLVGLLRGEALTLPYYRDAKFAAWLSQLREREQLHGVLIFSSAMAQYVLGADWKGVPRIIDFVDVDSDKWAQYASAKSFPMRWLFSREAHRLQAYELQLIREFDAGIFVSAVEAGLFRKLAPGYRHKVSHINNGVDLDYFSSATPLSNPYPPSVKAIVFTGAMDYWPNIDAVEWFARTVWPLLHEKDPATCFYIVGASPASSVRALARFSGVTVTGRVEDVRPYLRHARVSVAPLRVARGVQNKVLESMAMECPTVVSDAALEGIDAVPGRDLVLAHGAQGFAQSIRSILDDAEKADSLSRNGRNLVVRHYAWDKSLEALDDLLDSSLHLRAVN